EHAAPGRPQGAVRRPQRDDGLHRAFAKGAGADHCRPLVVLQGAGDDFRRRGRAAVDQDDQRLSLREIARTRVEALRLFGITSPRRHDLALLQERIGGRNRLIEQATWIVAQIEDVALELVVGDLGADIGDRLLQAFGGLLIELRKTDVADVFTFDLRTHRAQTDDIACDRHFDRLVLALAHDGELDLGVHRSTHFLAGLVPGKTLDLVHRADGGY